MLTTNPNIVKPDYTEKRTIVWIPSIFFGEYVSGKSTEFQYYEERYLYVLYYLKQPNTKLVVAMSEGFTPVVVDHFMEHICKITRLSEEQIKERFTFIEVPSEGGRPLAEHILKNEDVLKQISDAIDDKETAFMESFIVSPLEIELAKKLELPLYGLDEKVFEINTKSSSRKLFKEAGVDLPEGFEDLFSFEDVYASLQKLLETTPARKFVLKINDGGVIRHLTDLRVDRLTTQARPVRVALALLTGAATIVVEEGARTVDQHHHVVGTGRRTVAALDHHLEAEGAVALPELALEPVARDHQVVDLRQVRRGEPVARRDDVDLAGRIGLDQVRLISRQPAILDDPEISRHLVLLLQAEAQGHDEAAVLARCEDGLVDHFLLQCILSFSRRSPRWKDNLNR